MVVEPRSELAKHIKRERIGYCADSLEVSDIVSMLQNMLNSSEASEVRKQRVEEYYKEHCEREKILGIWSGLISDLH